VWTGDGAEALLHVGGVYLRAREFWAMVPFMRRQGAVMGVMLGATLAALAPCGWGQAAQPAPVRPVDQVEILGRLATGDSPSYVAHLVKVRGVSFAPGGTFIEEVKQAGGDGVLVERLMGAKPANESASEEDRPLTHLSKCAALIHQGNKGEAEKECRAAIDENPRSDWVLRAMANLLDRGDSILVTQAEAKRGEESVSLRARADMLDPSAGEAGLSDDEKAMVQEQFMALSNFDSSNLNYVRMLVKLSKQATIGAGASAEIAPNEARDRQVALEPDLAINHLALAGAYSNIGNHAKAESELREAVRLEPDTSRWHILLGVELLIQDRNEAGLAEMREAVRIAPFGDYERVALAGALENLGRIDEAEKELQAGLTMNPYDQGISDELVELDAEHHNIRGAVEELRRGLALSRAAYNDEKQFVDERQQTETELAEFLAVSGRFGEAEEQYSYLLRFDSEDATLHADYGQTLYLDHKYNEAISEFYEAVRLDPHSAAAHQRLGACLIAKKDYDAAIGEERAALAIDPNGDGAKMQIGMALGKKGDMQEAKDQFEQVVKDRRNDENAEIQVAMALSELKDDADALGHLKAALAKDEGSTVLMNNIAWIYCTSEDPKLRNNAEALRLAREAVAATAEAPQASFVDTLAEAEYVNGQAEEALKTEMEAAKLDPDNPEMQERLEVFRERAKKK
jgi:tetratricopeptide (TPR) repeat protein